MALSACNSTTDLHNRELIEHGNTAFPIACYADDLSADLVPWHWHDEWEFAIVSEGSPFFLLENKQLKLEKGDGIFVNTKALHAVEDLHRTNAKLHSGVFHPRLIGGNAESVFWQSLVLPLTNNSHVRYFLLRQNISWENQVLDCFHQAWNAVADETEDYENEVRYQLSKAIRTLIQNSDFKIKALSASEVTNADRIRTMLEYIENYYMEDITVDGIADSIPASPSVVLRCFHQMLNTTPMQYVKQLRIQKAAELLKTTNQSAKDIALSCGFNDISYFTKTFREMYHCTPGVYRKRKYDVS